MDEIFDDEYEVMIQQRAATSIVTHAMAHLDKLWLDYYYMDDQVFIDGLHDAIVKLDTIYDQLVDEELSRGSIRFSCYFIKDS